MGTPEDVPLYEFTSHIDGKNAQVRIYVDRVEWSKKGLLGAGVKAGLAVSTTGLSYLATGFTRKNSSEMIPVKSITSVTSRKGKGFNTVVSVITAGNTLEMRVGHDQAEAAKSTLNSLVAGTHPAQRKPSDFPPPPMPAAAPQDPVSDIAAQIQKLASLRDAGVLTEEEFTTKKAELLSRI